MTLLVDTSVWSLVLRRDNAAHLPEVRALRAAILGDELVVTTGIVLQELLQGFSGPRSHEQIVDRFSSLTFVQPDRADHIAAAGISTTCRRAGVQLGTVDALIAQVCIRHDLTLLTTDSDFRHAAGHCPLTVWPARPGSG